MTQALQELKDWILKRNPEYSDIPMDLDLIESRMIDSLSFVEFIFLLEQVSDRTIDMETLDLEDFRRLSAIEAKFLTPA